MFQKQPLSDDMKRVLAYVVRHPGQTAPKIKAGVADVSHVSLLCLFDEGYVKRSNEAGRAVYFATEAGRLE